MSKNVQTLIEKIHYKKMLTITSLQQVIICLLVEDLASVLRAAVWWVQWLLNTGVAMAFFKIKQWNLPHWLFLSLEHLVALVQLSIGLISVLLCLKEQGGHGEGERGNGQSLEQSEHTQHLLTNFSVLHGHSSWHAPTPEIVAIVTSKTTDHRLP